jgi:subtilisin family serine protease
MASQESDRHGLLTRHRAVLVGSAMLRGDQVMVDAAAIGRVPAGLRRWLDEPLPPRAGVQRWPLRAGTDVRRLLADAGPDPVVEAVHLLRAAPRWRSGPARPPVLVQEAATAPQPADPSAPPVTVAVLDTGVAAHPWFAHRPWFAQVTDDQFEVLDANHDGRLDSVAGHGTFVAGVVQQHAPSARLRIRRVLHTDGICDEVGLIEALGELADDPEPAEIVNLSFGGHSHDDRVSWLLDRAVRRLTDSSVVVAAAGNSGTQRPFWPAALPHVIAVGALDVAGSAPAEFSNRGAWVDAWAVGADVLGAFVASARQLPAPVEPAGCFARWSGTSFAAPVVAGRIAALVGRGATVRAAAEEVVGTAVGRSA